MQEISFKLNGNPVTRTLHDQRLLQAAAEKFTWKPDKAPSGRGFGVACGIDAGTYVTTMAEVEVEQKKRRDQGQKSVLCTGYGALYKSGRCQDPNGGLRDDGYGLCLKPNIPHV